MGKRSKVIHAQQTNDNRTRLQTSPATPAIDIGALIQLEMIRTLRSLNAPSRNDHLLTDEQDLLEVPEWLRR
jgi:hypothetical protein